MELFAKIVNDSKSLTISAKSSILDVWQGSGYASSNTNREIHIEGNQLDCVIKKTKKSESYGPILQNIFLIDFYKSWYSLLKKAVISLSKYSIIECIILKYSTL